MLLTFQQREERQLLGIATRMGGDKRPLVVGWAVEGMQFAGGQRRFKTRIGGPFDRRQTG
jgi:hypothetical protein